MRIVSPDTGKEVEVQVDKSSRSSNEFHIIIRTPQGAFIGGRQFDDEQEAIDDGWWK